MRKSKADPRHPPIEDLQGQVYQHELGDPDRAEQIERILDEWGRKASARQGGRPRKRPRPLPRRTGSAGSVPQRHKHLLIAIDASEVSERALAYVAELMAGRQHIRVTVLHVPQPIPPRLLEFGGRENPLEEKAAESVLAGGRTDWIADEQLAAAIMFARAREVLRKAGVRDELVETQVVDWNPNQSLDDAILEIAREKHCGAVVVGCAAFSGSQELLHPPFAKVLGQRPPEIAIRIVD